MKRVVTNGCFDILHAGHVEFLTKARALGDSLLVGINDDTGVRALKGSLRPVNTEDNRATVLRALRAVTEVVIFKGTKATDFLREANPDVYVKGGDYTIETLDAEERAVLGKCRSEIIILPLTGDISTNKLVSNIIHRWCNDLRIWASCDP